MRRLLGRLRISHKILISSLMFALPIVVLLYFMVTGLYDTIRFSRQEIWGIRILDPLERLSELLSEHQMLVRLSVEGNKGLEQKIREDGTKIDAAFALLLKEGGLLEDPLKISEREMKAADMEQAYYKTIYKNWQRLSLAWTGFDNTMQNDAEHETVLQPIHGLIKKLGDTSNIVLDPDLAPTYLVDVALVGLPKTQKRLSAFVLYVESLLYKGFRSKDDVSRLGVYVAFLEDDLEQIRRSMATAVQESGKFYGGSPSLEKNIAPALTRYESQLMEFLVIGRLMATDPDYAIPTAEFLESAKKVVDAESALRQVSMAELKALVEKRIGYLRTKAVAALTLSLAVLFFAVTVVLFISRGITRPLRKVAAIAGEIAAGNLQKASVGLEAMRQTDFHLDFKANGSKGKAGNEILQLFYAVTTMTSGLDSLLTQVRKSGIQVSASSTEIAASARQLEATVAEQAASISEVSATSTEISATARDFASRMNSVTEMATDAAELADSSMSSLALINATMSSLLENTSRSSEKLRAINEKMGNIGQVITAITKVANQINLLSLNAAIEAEKAGEYGIGFSVVAREIRRLADQTAVAALEIETMITETQVSVKDGMAAVEVYTRETESSTEKMADVGFHLKSVIGHTRDLQPHLEAVNEGMHMQRDSAGQISEAMAQLNETARQTRDSLVEFKKVTQQLNEAVRGLQDEVARFTVSS